MRPEETSVNGSGQAVREALARKRAWEEHGPSQWGYGVAIDLLALERRVAALERLSGAGKSAGEESDSPGEGWRWVEQGKPVMAGDEYLSSVTNAWCQSYWRDAAPYRTYRRRIKSHANHDAAPAARAQLPEADHAACRNRESDAGTGGTRQPVAWAVMSGTRYYDVYDTPGEADVICRWLCGDGSGDIWRVVPLVPEQADAEIARLREAIRRLADQDATLSVCNGSVTVTMDSTLTEAEREAIRTVAEAYAENDGDQECERIASIMQGLWQRTK
jgi:hypothetical protein